MDWHEIESRRSDKLNERVRKIFADINQLLYDSENYGTRHGEHLWALLSALRGPDAEEQWMMKEKTTAVLRAIVVPNQTFGDSNGRADDRRKLRNRDYDTIESETGHFESHINRAIDALEEFGLFDEPIESVYTISAGMSNEEIRDEAEGREEDIPF